MTTPTREQVVQWMYQSGLGGFSMSDEITKLSTLARADIEATIAEQAAEIGRLKLIEESALKVCSQMDEVVLAIPDCRYMDLPDGGDVSLGEQVKRMWQDVQKWELAASKNADCIRDQQKQLSAEQAKIAELEAIEANLCDLHNVALEQVAAEQAKVKLLTEVMEYVLVWDRARRFIVPYHVRDPIKSALSTVKNGK